ncbi:hypothetical protein I3843_14G056000 [Carya illinoinensis]|nr:hypothetical protein I3843_14G056000 [Carya illinoinensis]
MVSESENNDGKPQAKCKMCGVTYMAASKYGTGNMKRHIDACPRRSSRDIGQMMLSQDIVEALVYTRDWLYGEEQETQEVKLDELTENVMELEKNKDKEDAPPHS